MQKFPIVTVSTAQVTNEKLTKFLPHGSGINSNWEILITTRQTKIVCRNSFHTMTEHGYYDYRVSFSVTFDLEDSPVNWAQNFVLQFHGSRGQYYAEKYMLRVYLTDLFYEAIKPVISATVTTEYI